MSPVTTQNQHGRTYRYYVATTVQQGLDVPDDDVVRRISAASLEAFLSERLGRLMPSIALFPNGTVNRIGTMPASLVISLDAQKLPRYTTDAVCCVEGLRRRLRDDERLWSDDADPAVLKLAIAVRPKLTGGRTQFLTACGRQSSLIARRDDGLIRALRTAHARVSAWQDNPQNSSPVGSDYDRRLACLAFLAPDIQRAILDGRQPATLTLQALRGIDIPMGWKEKRSLLLGQAIPARAEIFPQRFPQPSLKNCPSKPIGGADFGRLRRRRWICAKQKMVARFSQKTRAGKNPRCREKAKPYCRARGQRLPSRNAGS